MNPFSWIARDPTEEVRRAIPTVYNRLWRYCYVLTGSRSLADDLVQAGCLRALEKASSFKSGTHFDRWIFRLTQRVWLNELRKKAVRSGGGLLQVEEIDIEDKALNPEESAISREVIDSIMRLPEAQRSAVVLVYVEGHSYRDAAMILDVPVGTIMSRLSVARGKIAMEHQVQQRVVND